MAGVTLFDAVLGLLAILLGLVAWLAKQLYGQLREDVRAASTTCIGHVANLRVEVDAVRAASPRVAERLARLEALVGIHREWSDPLDAFRDEWQRLQRERPR